MSMLYLTASYGAGEFCQDTEVKGSEPTISLDKSWVVYDTKSVVEFPSWKSLLKQVEISRCVAEW